MLPAEKLDQLDVAVPARRWNVRKIGLVFPREAEGKVFLRGTDETWVLRPTFLAGGLAGTVNRGDGGRASGMTNG